MTSQQPGSAGTLAVLYADLRWSVGAFRDYWATRGLRRVCWHHDRATGKSWVQSELIDLGRAKAEWCTRCGKVVV